jgi:hypothetical protein
MKYSLPTNEVSAQNQLALVKIYVQKSGRERQTVRIDEIKALSPVKSDRISKCHRFLVDVGLLIKEGHSYKPSEDAVRISEYLADENDFAVQESLRTLIARSWFGRFVEELLRLVGSISRESLIERLLISAQVPDVDLNREKAGVLIDWLLMATFIQKDSNGGFILSGTPLSQDGEYTGGLGKAKVDLGNEGEQNIKLNVTIEVSLSELDQELRSEIVKLIKQKLR